MTVTSFDTAPPRLDSSALADIAATHFGIDGAIETLDSERDQNARICCIDSDSYVLKIANSAESLEFLTMQNAALRHLADRDPALGVPRVCPARDGNGLATLGDGDGNLVRMLTYLPGTVLKEAPKSPRLLTNLGRFMGRVDSALQGFMHPAAIRPDFLWNLDNAAACRD